MLRDVVVFAVGSVARTTLGILLSEVSGPYGGPAPVIRREERTRVMEEATEQAPAGDAGELERLRVENARLRAEVERVEASSARTQSTKRRTVAFVLLVVLGSTMLPVSVMTIWIRNQVLDTDRYVATVEPLASDPTIQSAVIDRISTRVSEELDIESFAREELPENTAFLAAPIAAGADNLIRQAATRVVESDQFEDLWAEANRSAHDGLVVALTGREGEVVSTSDGKVVLRLGGVVAEVLDRIDDRFGSGLSGRVPVDRLDVDFVIVDSAQLAGVQAAVRWLDRLSWFSAILTLALFAGAVAVAPNRRRGVLFVGLGVAVSMLVLRVAFAVGRDLYLMNLPDAVERADAAAVIFDTLTRYVLQATRAVFAVGLVMVLAGWLTGGTAPAVAVRNAWDRLLGRGSAASGSAVDLGPVPVFVNRHLTWFRGLILAIAVIVLLTWGYPTGRVVLLLALATLIPLALVQFLAGMSPPVDRPDPESLR